MVIYIPVCSGPFPFGRKGSEMKHFCIESNRITVIEVVRKLDGLDGDPGYLIRHSDSSREEWWPEVHLDPFTPGTGLSFSTALVLLCAGHHIRRASWPEAWVYLKLNLAGRNRFYLVSQKAKEPVPRPVFLPEDILARDWILV